jgi:hypothetical protein
VSAQRKNTGIFGFCRVIDRAATNWWLAGSRTNVTIFVRRCAAWRYGVSLIVKSVIKSVWNVGVKGFGRGGWTRREHVFFVGRQSRKG